MEDRLYLNDCLNMLAAIQILSIIIWTGVSKKLDTHEVQKIRHPRGARIRHPRGAKIRHPRGVKIRHPRGAFTIDDHQ